MPIHTRTPSCSHEVPHTVRSLRPCPGAATLLVLLAVCLGARAEDDDPQERLMARARSAFAAGDEAELRKVVSEDDPWKVVTALAALGELDLAERLARLPEGPDARRLPEEVAAWRAWPGDRAESAAAYRRLREAEVHVRRGQPPKARVALEAWEPPKGLPRSFAARLHTIRMLLATSGAVVQEGIAGATVSREIGWWNRVWSNVTVAGDQSFAIGDVASGRVLWEMGVEATRARERPSDTAYAESRLGACLLGLGRPVEALEHLSASAAWFDAHPDAQRAEHLDFVLATTLHQTGREDDAIELLRRVGPRNPRAVALWSAIHQQQGRLDDAAAVLDAGSRALPPDASPNDRAVLAVQRANLLRSSGAFSEALGAYREAVGNSRFLEDPETAISARTGLAAHLQGVGDLDAARKAFEEALKLAEAVRHPTLVATIGIFLSALEREAGDLERAAAHATRALKAARERGDDLRAAAALVEEGVVRLAAGAPGEALERIREGRAAYRSRNDALGDLRASVYLAEALGRVGKSSEALEAAREASRRADAMGLPEAAWMAQGVEARIRLEAGDAPAALALVRTTVSRLSTMARWQPVERAAGFRESWDEVFQVGLRAALAVGDVAALAGLVEAGRAWSLRESLGGNDLLRSLEVPPELAQALARATREMDESRTAHLSFPADGLRDTAREASARLRRAEEAVRSVEERIAGRLAAAAAPTRPAAAGVEEIRAALSDDYVLVEHVRIGDDLHALVVDRSSVRVVPLGPLGPIASDLNAFAAAVENGSPVSEDLRLRLRERLVTPLGLEGAAHVLLSPDGPTHSVPPHWIVPEWRVAVVPSGTALAALRRLPPGAAGPVLAVGNPTADVRAGSLGALPGAEREALAIGDVVLLRSGATARTVRAAIASRGRWRSVHFGCHGILNDAAPTFSSLLLASEEGGPGYLMQNEVLRMRVRADLVALSACDSARGRSWRGGGFVGLTRAFLVAGARSVIGGLWRVDDAATQALMLEFYRLWNPRDGTPGLGVADALSLAQDHVRSQPQWKDPRFWAAWVVVGLPD